MGRREDREALESTWSVYEPRVPGTPFRRKDIEDVNAREEADVHNARVLLQNTHEFEAGAAAAERAENAEPAKGSGLRSVIGRMWPREVVRALAGLKP